MRNISIFVNARIGVPTDNEFIFNAKMSVDQEQVSLNDVYSLSSLQLNYSILNSTSTGTMILTMSEPLSDDNILKSGQYVTISDNGVTIFEGILLSCNYEVLPMSLTSQGNTVLEATIAPSIYQFTLSPVIFDNKQVNQIKQVTNIAIDAILAGSVTQSADTSSLLSYMVTNTDYKLFFGKDIQTSDLGSSLYVMANLGDPKDSVIRQSIDYYNCIFYQQEDGQIIIRQIDYSLSAPFSIDTSNQYITASDEDNEVPTIPLLTYNYTDNAYSTPCAISNYAMLSPNYAATGNADVLLLTYAPNTQYFPRLKDLQSSGWFVGEIDNTQINDNIISDPTTATALNEFFKAPDAFMLASKATGVKDQTVASYQALLTAKRTAVAIGNYSAFSGTISLDDPNVPDELGNIIGTIIQIHNLSNMPNGVIATASRFYSAQGSYLTFSVAPPGSYTGFWKNSNATQSY